MNLSFKTVTMAAGLGLAMMAGAQASPVSMNSSAHAVTVGQTATGDKIVLGRHTAQHRRAQRRAARRAQRRAQRRAERRAERREIRRDRRRVRRLRGYRGYRSYRRGYRRYNDGWWYPPAAFVIGGIIGNAIADRDYSSRHHNWCDNRYRSYRRSDGTFQPYGNVPRKRCNSPYDGI